VSLMSACFASWPSCSLPGMDICVRKPLLVTCSTDKSVRFW
jgi:hypothetical protein